MNDSFKTVVDLYKSTESKYKSNMTKEMLVDDFFLDVGIRDILNLTYEEHKTLKKEEQDENIDYTKTIDKLINKFDYSHNTIEKILKDYYEEYKK